MSLVRSLYGRIRIAAVTLLLLIMLASLPVLGQAQLSPASDELERGTPRGAMTGFLNASHERDFERAANYLSLENLDPNTASLGGAELARRLSVVLDQGLWIDLEGLSDDPAGDREDGSQTRDELGIVELPHGGFKVVLQRHEDGDGLWAVAAVTVARASSAYDKLGLHGIERFVPAFLLDMRVLDVFLWQWIAMLVFVVAAWIGSWALAFGISRIVRPLVVRTASEFDDDLFELALPPLRLMLGVFVMLMGFRLLGLAAPVMELTTHVLRAVALVAIVWFLSRFIDLLSGSIEQHLRERGGTGASQLVTPGRRTAKIAIGIVGFVALLDNFGFDVAALIAGLGVGGIAVALAAQKTVENLFGGVTLLADQPVRVGDYCRYGDKTGTVEYIGLRSTRIRSLDRTVVTVPNADFATMQLENFAKRDRIRLRTIIGLLYETTPDQMRYVLVEIRRMLYSHQKVLSDPTRVRFVEFSSSSLTIEVMAYVETSNWSEFLGVREDVYLRIMSIIDSSGTSFAFPSQTLYLGRDTGVDREKTDRVESEVQGWRERQEVYLPEFPPEAITELENTLRYPAEGAPGRG